MYDWCRDRYNKAMNLIKNCSVLIPYYCKPESISNVLTAIVDFKEELNPWKLCEILVLLDGSPLPEQELPPITRCITLEKNQGLSNARNVLLKECKGDFIIFLDADAVLMKGSFASIVQHWDGKSLIAGAEYRSPETGLVNKFRRYFWIQTQGYQRTPEAPYFFGIAFAASREILRKVGEFDRKMGNYGEDIEYSLRLKNMGHNIQYEPDFKVFHLRQDSLLSLTKLIYNHSKSQILAHQMHQCSIIEIVWNSFIWVFVASGSALKTHKSVPLFCLATVLCFWAFSVKFSVGLVGSVRRK